MADVGFNSSCWDGKFGRPRNKMDSPQSTGMGIMSIFFWPTSPQVQPKILQPSCLASLGDITNLFFLYKKNYSNVIQKWSFNLYIHNIIYIYIYIIWVNEKKKRMIERNRWQYEVMIMSLRYINERCKMTKIL